MGNSLAASAFKRKTIISAVAVEVPFICLFAILLTGVQRSSTLDIVSFMWLTTGAYAADKVEAGPGYFPFLDGAFDLFLADLTRLKPMHYKVHACVRLKVLEGIAFVNWIQRTLLIVEISDLQ